MSKPINNLVRPLLVTAVTFLLLAGASCDGCGGEPGDKKTGDPAVRKAGPAEKPPRPVKPRLAGKAADDEGEELATISLRSFTGEVSVISKLGEPARPAREGDEIRGGGGLFVAAGGSAKAVLREVGQFDVAPASAIVVPVHSTCGAVLLEGTVHTRGSSRERPDPSCYLHTAAGALLHPRAKAVVAVSAGGNARFAAQEGAIRIASPAADPIEVPEGSQATLFSRRGKDAEIGSFEYDGGSPERAFDEWLAGDPFGGGPQVEWMLKEADGLTERLALDVERLVELMALNREASGERRRLASQGEAANEALGEVTKRLAEQAEELSMLKGKGALLIGRIAALVETVRRHAPGSKEDRVGALLARIDKLAAELPPLFERRRKPSVQMKQFLQPKPEMPMADR